MLELSVSGLNNQTFGGAQQQKTLPISLDLLFLKYAHDEKQAFIFFYPAKNETWQLEADLNREDMKVFEAIICECLFVLHNSKEAT